MLVAVLNNPLMFKTFTYLCRVEFHQSLFQLSPASYSGIKTQFPRCQCALNSPSNSCTEDKNRSEFYSFIYQKDITSEFYVNKNKPLIIKSYNISSTSDISDNSVSLSRDARQQCKEVIRESDLFLKCIPLRGRILVDIVSVCEKMAAVQDRSTWIPIVLRLMESVCNFAFTSNTSLSDRNLPSGIDHVTRIKDLFRCPENCFEHGKCTRDGCACFKGYSGVECLDKAGKVPQLYSTFPSHQHQSSDFINVIFLSSLTFQKHVCKI